MLGEAGFADRDLARIAALEGGSRGVAFASGLAAIESILKRLSAGDQDATGLLDQRQAVIDRISCVFILSLAP